MTQMLLFDAPLTAAPLGTALVASAEVSSAEVLATALSSMPAKSIASMSQEAGSESVRLSGDVGPHHMGDLARLVLLRYELMAKRRERMAKERSVVGRG